jgi:hypothetical protein
MKPDQNAGQDHEGQKRGYHSGKPKFKPQCGITKAQGGIGQYTRGQKKEEK